MNNMPPPKMAMEYSSGTLSQKSVVTVGVTIPHNWHVNANIAADEFLKPSSIEISAQGIEFGDPIWPKPIKEYSEALDLENLVFKGYFEIKIPVKTVQKDCDSLSTIATFHYQACDNSICLAPSQVSIDINGSAVKGNPKGEIKSENSLGTVSNESEKNEEIEPSEKKDASQSGEKFDLIFEDGNSESANSLEEKKSDKEESNAAVDSENVIQEKQNGFSNAIVLLFFAFIGGILLNLMPCVLPVLSLKLFSLIKEAGESRRRLLTLGLSTTIGILASFWVLAAIISFVKANGGVPGWGMQFQSPGFIAFMVIILSAFAMSFFGVFEIWLPWNVTTKMDKAGSKAGHGGAFFTGALLVLLSTPCSAPFLGTAMGFAFTANAPVLFLFFTAAGAGLALPYILVSAFPRILNVLPKPGPWMVTLQKVMGVLLLASVGWLLWIVNEQAGSIGIAIFAALAMVTIALSFAVGKIAPPGVNFIREVASFAISGLILFAAWFTLAAPKYESTVVSQFESRMSAERLDDGWYRYSPELVKKFQKAGRTIFIDVTADWCLTCKANEAAVLSGEAFLHSMDSAGVIRMKADWTRESPAVNALLKSMGKSGVPAYALYPKGNPKNQIVFPELLTAESILEKIP